ncbi:MAG: DUF4157 domain-containing protein [Leptolyngbyaceae cyanobacterium SM2_5_2]|nr:DUF4157 domain-containing protein [Leptolyngbyaceae cyanobacterium SM2_5_2]
MSKSFFAKQNPAQKAIVQTQQNADNLLELEESQPQTEAADLAIAQTSTAEPPLPPADSPPANPPPSETNQPTIQAKLTLGEPNDLYEQEADQVASQAGHVPLAPVQAKPHITPLVQRQSEGQGSIDPQVEQGIHQTQGGGQPLHQSVQRSMEHALGADFRGVRIHADGKADQLNRALSARAFTTGQDIYFKQGEYQPGSQVGQKLLAHELVHTIQQSPHPGMGVKSTGLSIQRNGDEEEGVIETASREVLDQVLPVGNGFYFEVTGGITWGYPIYTGGAAVIYVDRVSEGSVRLFVRKEGRLAFDTGVGGSVMLGRGRSRGGTSGSRGVGIGAEAGANFMAGFRGVFIEEYSIPTTDFLTFVGASALETGLSVTPAAGMGDPILNLLGQNGDQYLTHQRIEGGVFAQADAEVGAGIRRPSDSFSEAVGDGEGVRRSGRAWGPNTEARDFQGARPDITNMDPLSLLNFLSVFASVNLSAQVTVGFDQSTQGNITTTSLFLEGQIGAMIGLPIPVIDQALSSLPADAGGGVELRFIQAPGEDPQIKVIVYLKQGEDQYYASSAGQQNMEFNLTNIVSVDQIIQAMQTGRMPTIPSVSFGNVLDTVSFFQRIVLGGQQLTGFAALLRRQRGARSLLSTNTLDRARRVYGVNLEAYLDFGAQINGVEFMDLARQLLSAGEGAYEATVEGEDLTSAYELLSSYLAGYVNSAEFERLQETVLNHTTVNIAKLRIQVGAGVGIAARVAEGAKARFDVSGETGLSCELDYVALRGGPLNLRDLIVGIQDVFNNPTTYLPNCPIIRTLYSDNSGGGGGSGTRQSSGTVAGERRRTSSSGGGISGAQADETGGSSTTSPATEQGQATSERRESSSSDGGGATSDLDISRNYPSSLPEIEFPILNVFGSLGPNTPVDTILSLTFVIQVQHADNRVIQVPIEVKVVGNSESQVELEVVEPWWIETLRIGSNTGHTYTLRFNE